MSNTEVAATLTKALRAADFGQEAYIIEDARSLAFGLAECARVMHLIAVRGNADAARFEAALNGIARGLAKRNNTMVKYFLRGVL